MIITILLITNYDSAIIEIITMIVIIIKTIKILLLL